MVSVSGSLHRQNRLLYQLFPFFTLYIDLPIRRQNRTPDVTFWSLDCELNHPFTFKNLQKLVPLRYCYRYKIISSNYMDGHIIPKIPFIHSLTTVRTRLMTRPSTLFIISSLYFVTDRFFTLHTSSSPNL